MSRHVWATSTLLWTALAASWAAIARADPADDQYATAAGLYARQEWKLAADEFQALLKQYPNYPQASRALFFLGEAQLQLGRYEDARGRFAEYLRREPQGDLAGKALFRSGEALYLEGKGGEAEPLLKDFLAKRPDDKLNAFVLAYLGEIALLKKDFKSAGEQFRQGLARFPDGPLQDDCRLGLARALEEQGQNDEALRLYLAVAGKTGNPLAPEAQFRLGSLQYDLRQFAEAVESFKELETKFPASPRLATARLVRGWAAFQLKRLDDAKTMFEGLLADPKLGVEARYWLAMVQREQKDWAAAAKTLELPPTAAPKHPLAAAIHFHRGDSLMRAGDLPGALKEFDLAIAAADGKDPWLDDAWRGKVQAALQAKDHALVDQAAAEFLKRMPASPLAADVLRSRGQSLVERRQFDEAAKVLEPLAAAPGQEETKLQTRYLLALAYEGLSRPQDALAQLAPVLQSGAAPLKSAAQLTEAAIRMGMKQYAEAIAPLEAHVAANPAGDEAAGARARLAVCYARAKQLDKAKKLFGELVEKHGTSPTLPAAVEQLAEAALDAGDADWSAALFGRLAAGRGQSGEELRGLSGLAWSQYRAGRLTEAAATFGQLLEKDPPEALAADAALVRGTIFEKLKQPDPALAMFDQVIDKYPKSKQYGDALLAAARLRDALNQDDRAAALYDRYVQAFPQAQGLDKVLYDRAWVLEELGRAEESAAVFERIHKEQSKSPYWPDATYRLARRALDAHDNAKAAGLAAAVLAAQPKPEVRQHALYLQGQAFAAQDKWDEVRRAFETLAKDHPGGPLRWAAEFWVAEAMYHKKDYDAAGKQLDEVARQTQGQSEPWMAMIALRRAQVLAQQKKWDEALALASKIAGQFPQFEQLYEADFVIGRCLAMQAKFDEAREVYQRVTQSPQGTKTETAAMAQWYIGESYFHQKDYEAALAAYLRVEILYKFPEWQARALFEAAKCREMLGEWDAAVKLYERLLRDFPDSPHKDEAKKFLSEARQRLAGRPAPQGPLP